MNQELLLSKIEDELFFLNIDCENESGQIKWKDNFGAENHIIHCDNFQENLVWWKSNDVGKDLVMFTKDNFVVSWQPNLNNMGMSFGCIFLKFYYEKIIVAYPDKHRDRIFILNTTNLHAEEIYHAQTLGLAMKDSFLYINDMEKGIFFSLNLENNLEKMMLSENDFIHKNLEVRTRYRRN